MTTQHLLWNWKGSTVRLGLDHLGAGPSILLLPALSSISTRREMRPLQERLASDFETFAIDWPGFGDEPRPAIPWEPPVYLNFLQHVLSDVVPNPFATIAAGHAASYALWAAAKAPTSTGILCLIAPTWRGPLPTIMNGRRTIGKWISRAGDLPVIGDLLYRLNVNPPVVRMMARGHVYSDPDWLTDERLTEKNAVVSAPGARFASVRFVTGMLDLLQDRSSFLETARRVKNPILVIYGAETPKRSKAEIEALEAVPNVELVKLQQGKLAIHEEFPDAVVKAVRSFLSRWTH